MQLNFTVESFRKALRKLEREITAQLKNETSCCGITLAQCHLLYEISEKGGLTISELAENFGLNKSSLSRSVDGLVRSGYLKRKERDSDRRILDLALSEEGRKKISEIDCTCDTGYKDIFNSIPGEEHKTIIRALELIAETMEKKRLEENNGNRCCQNMR